MALKHALNLRLAETAFSICKMAHFVCEVDFTGCKLKPCRQSIVKKPPKKEALLDIILVQQIILRLFYSSSEDYDCLSHT